MASTRMTVKWVPLGVVVIAACAFRPVFLPSDSGDGSDDAGSTAADEAADDAADAGPTSAADGDATASEVTTGPSTESGDGDGDAAETAPTETWGDGDGDMTTAPDGDASWTGDGDGDTGVGCTVPQPESGLYSHCLGPGECGGNKVCFGVADAMGQIVDGHCTEFCGPGTVCPGFASCGEGMCLTVTGGNQVCSLSCETTDDCPVGMECRADSVGTSFCM